MGETSFDGLSLVTAPGRVMTPRPTSEALVAAARAHLAGRARLGGRRARVVDVGTGSGAIAVAIATACPGVEVWATDVSRRAVALAALNVRRHGLEERVFVCHGDLLAAAPARVDLIVANLPYVAASTAARHPDLAGEPPDAVFAAGDGLDPYRRLVDAATTRLADGGALLLQLHGRVVVAASSDLPALRAALGDVAAAA